MSGELFRKGDLNPNACADTAGRQLLGLTKKWLLKTVFLNSWFVKWYSAKGYHKAILDVLEQRQLLFPCYRFDHAEGFARATCFLAYHVRGHIQEVNPTDHDELHLPIFTTRGCPSD